MKLCPTCRNTYPDDYQTCPRDQSALTQEMLEIVPGTILRGKYEVLCELGSGGMATVYKVKHKAFQETAAVKVVHSKFMHDPGFVKRFRNEAIVARQLKHPNAVRIDDFDYTEDGRPFIVMEYVEGSSLYEVRKQHGGPWPVERCLNIVSQAASALSAAHTLGIVHRDIKPSNILLLRGTGGGGVVKVLDFGIAKVSENSFAGMTSVVTQSDLIIGTPEYMSPEQASGHLESSIDGRADLYSLGLVFYEMLTGAHPFHADTPMGMLIQQVHTMPAPPDTFPVHMSPAISALVLKTLQKEPKDRFQSASEMLDAMKDPEAWYSKTQPNKTQPSSTHSPAPQDAPTAPYSAPGAAVLKTPSPATPSPSVPPAPPQPQTAVPPVNAAPSDAPPSPTSIASPAEIPFAPVMQPSTSAGITTPPPSVQSAPAQPVSAQYASPQVKKKSKAALIITLTLAAMMIIAIGLFFAYRTVMSRIKGPQEATTTSQTQTPPVSQPTPAPANQESDVKANVTKLVAMGNDALTSKQSEVATTYFQQALNLDPANAEAKAGLEKANTASTAKPANIPPANPAPPAKVEPPPDKPKPVKVGPLHVPPEKMFQSLISSPAPVYPPVAKTAHIQGAVTLHAIIAKNGTVKQLEPISGLKIFHDSAVTAVQQWRYKPYLVNNVPTEVDTTITVNYTIARK
jgi:serine/threonine-protein kinase